MHADSTLRIWLVRHGQTLFNELGRAQGWCDSPLTDEGRQGLRALGERLRHMTWDGAYSSTSERAVESAEIVTEGKIEITRDWRWKEYNFGIWEAQPNEEMIAALQALVPIDKGPVPAFHGIFSGDFPALERGETGAEFRERVALAIEDIRSEHQSGNIIVATHGITIGVASAIVEPDFDFARGLENATFSVFEYRSDGSARILARGISDPASVPELQ